MRIDILTLFPEMFAPLEHSILKRGAGKELFEIHLHNIRDFAENKHKKCDDYPFGGGAGMVMMAQPIASCVCAIDPERKAKRFYMSPQGKVFCQSMAEDFSKEERIILLCGHYEGVDQRVLDMHFDGEISIGDFVLTGGELGAMVVCDAVLRLVSGVIDSESLKEESFSSGLLEYPQYTRPSVFEGMEVPSVLLSGNHAEIEKWRQNMRVEITKQKRPDLLEKK